jgi:Mycothiol maleylpyruvate isomerase N-terminal domain
MDGLAEEHWQASVVPAGWTVADMIDHLGGAVRQWFQHVVNDHEVDHPWDESLPGVRPNGAASL